MTSPTQDAHRTIARCTRDGRILWQHVAQQMGISVDRARSQYDPAYEPVAPRREASKSAPATLAGRSTMIERILAVLAAGPATSAAIVQRTGDHPQSVYVRLNQLHRTGVVANDSGRPCAWRIVVAQNIEKAA